jgi:hypothetical protein
MEASDLETARRNVRNACWSADVASRPGLRDVYIPKIHFGHFKIYSEKPDAGESKKGKKKKKQKKDDLTGWKQ